MSSSCTRRHAPMIEVAQLARFDRISHPPQRLADEVYEQLIGGILAGIIEPGERLVQESLAEEMSVSRTPVREALLRLEQEGVIEPAPTRGFVVIEVTSDMLQSMYESRQAVEGFAARLVAESASDEVVEKLGPSLQIEIDMGDALSSYEENRAVHRAVVEASSNDTLLAMFDTLWSRARPLRIVYDTWAAELGRESIYHTHRELYDAICSRVGDAAEAAMVEHLEYGLQEQLATLARMRQSR